MIQSRSPLLVTKSKVQSAGVIERLSPCYHIIVVMAAWEKEPFFSSLSRPLAATVTLGHLIDRHP